MEGSAFCGSAHCLLQECPRQDAKQGVKGTETEFGLRESDISAPSKANTTGPKIQLRPYLIKQVGQPLELHPSNEDAGY